MLDVETKMELDSFLATFEEYQKETSLTPVEAVEKQARELRVRFIQEFKKVAPTSQKIDADVAFVRGKLKIRPSIKAREQQEASIYRFSKRGQETKGSVTKRITAHERAWAREISARKRSKGYLASTWVNPAHTSSKKPRQATFNHRSAQGSVVSQVRIATEGDSPQVQLRNFVMAVGDIGYGRGIIANGLASATANMHEYISRKQSEKNAAFQSQ